MSGILRAAKTNLVFLLFALATSLAAQPLEAAPAIIKSLSAHVNESRVPWNFTLSELPTFSNRRYQIRIEDPLTDWVQTIEFRNGVEIFPEDFELGDFGPGSLLGIRVKGDLNQGKVFHKIWVFDLNTNQYEFSPES